MSRTAEPTAEAVAAAPESLGRRASRGAVASVIGQGASQGLRLVGNLLLSHMLFPEAFGLMALVNMLQLGLQALSDLGLQPAIVRHPRGDERNFLDTAWTIGVARGVVLWVCGAALALPMAAFYHEPALAAIVPVATISALFGGFTSTKIASLTRHIRPTPVLMIEVSSQAVGLVAMIAMAKWRPSVWALVVGGIAAGIVRMALSYVAMPGPMNRFRWEKSARADLFTFGKWLFVSSIFTFLYMRIDVGILGRLLSVEVLGVYSIGIILSQVVRDVLQQITRFVIMPALSVSHRAGNEALAGSFAQVRQMSLPAALLAILGAALLAPPFFYYLYDPRYHDAAWIAQLSMLVVWFLYLTDVAGSALLAAGDSRSWAFVNAVRAIATAIGCVAGFAIGGVPALLLGSAVAAGVAYLVSVRLLVPHGFEALRGDLPYTALALALGFVGAGAPWIGAGGDAGVVAWRSLFTAPLVLVPYGLWVLRRLLRARG